MFDHGGQRVEVENAAVVLRQRGGGVENGAEEHQGGCQQADELRHVAQEHPKRCQGPTQAHQEKAERQQHQRQIEHGEVRNAEEEGVGNQPNAKADQGVKQGRQQRDKGKNFEREDDLLHVVGVGENQARRPVDALGKQVEDKQAGEEHQRKFGFRATAPAPARLENDAENEGVNRKHEERIEERPEHAEEGAAIAPQYFALGRGLDKFAVAPEAGKHFDW